MKRIVLAGIMGRYPVGGVTWCALHYIAALQRLGYEVFYLEDTGECPYDPRVNGVTPDPAYALGYLRRHLARLGLESSWTYVDYRGRWHGRSRAEVGEICRDASAIVNLSGGYWFSRPEYDHARKIFIDTDPGFTQDGLGPTAPSWYLDFFRSQDALFTFALNIGAAGCTIAPTPFQWQPTIQPLVLDFWPFTEPPPDAPYTTIMSWRVGSVGMDKGKAGAVRRLLALPRRTPHPIRLAVAGQAPVDLLRSWGWSTTDAVAATIDADSYQGFIQGSRGEVGLAKARYVDTWSGWFSDRTQCYLASGRPAVVADTGFGTVLPCGEGLIAFKTEDEVLSAIEAFEADSAMHRRRAREIAGEYFAAEKVVRSLLDRAAID